MAYDEVFIESIGLCGLLTRGLVGLSRSNGSVELLISGGPTQPGIWLRLNGNGGSHLRDLGETIIELDEDQVKKLRDLLNDALCTNAYGKGMAEMGGM